MGDRLYVFAGLYFTSSENFYNQKSEGSDSIEWLNVVASDAQWQLIRVPLDFKDLYMRYDCLVSKLDHNKIIICSGKSQSNNDHKLEALIFNTEDDVLSNPSVVALNED